MIIIIIMITIIIMMMIMILIKFHATVFQNKDLMIGKEIAASPVMINGPARVLLFYLLQKNKRKYYL